MKQPIEKESWNRKRLLMFWTVVVAVLVVGGIFLNEQLLSTQSQEVKGAATIQSQQDKNDNFNAMSANVSEQVRVKVESIKADVNSLDVNDVASSSPQIQKIIKDIKSMENYPSSQAKEICQKVCDGL